MSANSDIYEFYARGGIKKGLEPDDGKFTLNGKRIVLLSGAMHYFRIPKEYWRDRLLKLKASGLNTVETYAPWNLHEKLPGKYKFSDELDIRHFLLTAKEIGLFAILRPGPYICAEWEFGGLPYWLLRDRKMRVRTTYKPFIAAVDRYFEQLLLLVKDLQFMHNGPIIALQVENEYGSYGVDRDYVHLVKEIIEKYGIVEMLFTSDGPHFLENGGTIPGVLATVNFQCRSKSHLEILHAFQPDQPLMVSEFWTGWFDYWGGKHNTLAIERFKKKLRSILLRGASISFYMFHGGTNFGFMNGALGVKEPPYYYPNITSYDYDAIITESGDITEKYVHTKEFLRNFDSGFRERPLEDPLSVAKEAYKAINVASYLPIYRLLDMVTMEKHHDIVPMELLDCNDGAGQGYGYVFYRNTFESTGGKIQIEDRVRDRAHISLFHEDQKIINRTIDWLDENFEIELPKTGDHPHKLTLEILVENIGRVNYQDGIHVPEFVCYDDQRKGIAGDVWHNDKKLLDWEIFPLEFDAKFVAQLSNIEWINLDKAVKDDNVLAGGSVYKAVLYIRGKPKDTFLCPKNWGRGVAFMNYFNLGRYWETKGPQKTLYVPASCLREGENTVIMFELDCAQPKIEFSDHLFWKVEQS